MKTKIILTLLLMFALASFVSATSINENIEGLTYQGGDFDDINCQILGSAEWLGTEWVDSCQSSATVLYTIDDYSSARVSVIIEEYGKSFEDNILVESIEDLYDWDEFDSFDYSVIMDGIHLSYVTNNDKKQSMLFWKSDNYVVSVILDELPMSYSDDPLIESVLNSYLALYPLQLEEEESEPKINLSCIDSDGGIDVYVEGKAEIKDKGGQGDWCSSETEINEAYCKDDNTYTTKVIQCPSDAPYCSNGACSSKLALCEETDDGMNPEKLGTTYPKKTSDSSGHTDYCQSYATMQPVDSCSGEDCSLREFFCVEDSYRSSYRNVICLNGCSNGECEEYIEENVWQENEDLSQRYKIDKNINGLTYEGGDFDDINCQILGSAEWLGTSWINSCEASVVVLYNIDDTDSSRISVIIEQYGKDFENDILVESIEDLYDWDEFDTFDYSVIKNGVSLAYVTNNDKKQSMLFWKSGNYVVSIMVDELPMSYSDDPLIESVLDSYLISYPLTDSLESEEEIEEINQEEKCPLVGYRKDGKFCTEYGNYLSQRAGDEACENNFECISNSCLDSVCVEEGFWTKILNWFKNLFG